jgi:hypothetical protein
MKAFADLNPDCDHLTEVAEILALGLQRLNARQSSDFSERRGESSLHSDADQSGHAAPFSPEASP